MDNFPQDHERLLFNMFYKIEFYCVLFCLNFYPLEILLFSENVFNSGSISPCRYSPKVPRKKRLKKTMYHIVQNGGKLRSESVLSLLVGGSNFSQAYLL